MKLARGGHRSPVLLQLRMLVGTCVLDRHGNGAEQIAAAARASGIDVIYEGIRLSPPLIADAALDTLEKGMQTADLSTLSLHPPETAMPKPVMNLDEVEFDDVEANGRFTSSRGSIGRHIGARDLGYNLTVLPPGKVQCPFHSHHGEEEMFLILDGEGELRFGDQRYPLRKHDVIACPTGGPEVAHQIINTGTVPMRYLALSTLVDIEVCEYPDSGKVMLGADRAGQAGLRKMFRATDTVDYYDGEEV